MLILLHIVVTVPFICRDLHMYQKLGVNFIHLLADLMRNINVNHGGIE